MHLISEENYDTENFNNVNFETEFPVNEFVITEVSSSELPINELPNTKLFGNEFFDDDAMTENVVEELMEFELGNGNDEHGYFLGDENEFDETFLEIPLSFIFFSLLMIVLFKLAYKNQK